MAILAPALAAALVAAALLSMTTTTTTTALGGLLSADKENDCDLLPTWTELRDALRASVKPTDGPSNGGLDNNMWAALVDRSGVVCAVAFSGERYTDQWLASRVLAVQKATTANAVSLDGFAMSTANLYSATQPGGMMYGLHASMPVNDQDVCRGLASSFGTEQDPMTGKRIGGVNVFGGGLPLYKSIPGDDVRKVGGVGVSGDLSCADNNVAWRVRAALKLEPVVGKVAGLVKGVSDAMILDRDKSGAEAGTAQGSQSGWGHPSCNSQTRTVGRGISAVYDTIAGA